jgi:cytidine deaminase
VKNKLSQELLDELRRAARDAATQAYAPYSRFPVGAAVLCSRVVYTGANIENASYGLSVCAERNAIFSAIARGMRRIDAICVYTPTSASVTPCGACLQVLSEFAADGAVIVCCTDDETAEQRYALADLLPAAFRLKK